MPSLPVFRTVIRELLTLESAPRVPEPDLVMDSEEAVEAFTCAGREAGVMAPVYLFHAIHISEVITPGDTVIDLACGPATQLGLVARLNPDAQFIGIDLSKGMLKRASDYIQSQGLKNVTFQEGSIDSLDWLENQSVDAVMSTMALHHLPDIHSLANTFLEVGRVLKQNGGIYLADFGHLKSEKSIRYFAFQYADKQPQKFTEDYHHSLRAAFYLSDYKKAASPLTARARLYSTFMLPFMVALKSNPRRKADNMLREKLIRIRDNLPLYHQIDFNDLKVFFQLNGLSSFLIK
jgi:arsenite methyltransferase